MARSTRIDALYDTPLMATRSGALFNAHAYPTKIDPAAIALAIACHTRPGETVFDGFGGSGTTGLAALMCSKPSDALRARAKSLGLQPRWGERRALVYELTGLGSFIGKTLCTRVDVQQFRRCAENILADAVQAIGWLYELEDDCGGVGVLRHNVWSEVLICPHCYASNSLWDGCVRLSPVSIDNAFRCSGCHRKVAVAEAARKVSKRFDDILGERVSSRTRVLGRVYGANGSRSWSREPRRSDERLTQRIESAAIPAGFPLEKMRWGDLHRSGYHSGISHVHHFYTRRNLIALAAVNERIDASPPDVRDALRLWLSSYNSSHSTLMTRVVAKAGQDDLVVTSNQPGVLYVSGLPVEKNVFRGLRRKLNTLTDALGQAGEYEGHVEVVQGSSAKTSLPNASIDYVFTDPPFGANIPYSEANFISEAWLGRTTEQKDEAIVSSAQGKGLAEYENLLTDCFREVRRILKPEREATVVFHSSEAKVWRALIQAFERSGFSVENSSILDKRQGSFKQVTTRNSVKGDALLLLRSRTREREVPLPLHLQVMRQLVARAIGSEQVDEQTVQRLYSRFINSYVEQHANPPLDADQFYGQLETHFFRNGQLELPE